MEISTKIKIEDCDFKKSILDKLDSIDDNLKNINCNPKQRSEHPKFDTKGNYVPFQEATRKYHVSERLLDKIVRVFWVEKRVLNNGDVELHKESLRRAMDELDTNTRFLGEVIELNTMEVNRGIDDVGDNVNNLKSDIGGLEADISNLAADVEELKDDQEELQDENEELQDEQKKPEDKGRSYGKYSPPMILALEKLYEYAKKEGITKQEAVDVAITWYESEHRVPLKNGTTTVSTLNILDATDPTGFLGIIDARMRHTR